MNYSTPPSPRKFGHVGNMRSIYVNISFTNLETLFCFFFEVTITWNPILCCYPCAENHLSGPRRSGRMSSHQYNWEGHCITAWWFKVAALLMGGLKQMCFKFTLLLHCLSVIFKIGICILSIVVCHWKCVCIHTCVYIYIALVVAFWPVNI